MNLAFPALFILLLVLPGIVIRYSYARGPWRWASPTSITNLSDEIAFGVVFAFALHVLWLWLARCFGREPDIESAMSLMLGAFGDKSARLDTALSSVANHVPEVAFYFLSLNVAAGCFGLLLHWFVRSLELDWRYKFFRFNNEWYYLLSGEFVDFAESPEKGASFDFVYLSTVVDHDEGSFLYRGIVRDFSFDRQGQLDKVILTVAHRRKLASDRDVPATGEVESMVDDRYYIIEGDYFILRYSEMTTINLDYFALYEE